MELLVERSWRGEQRKRRRWQRVSKAKTNTAERPGKAPNETRGGGAGCTTGSTGSTGADEWG